jgi:hypothetical protein
MKRDDRRGYGAWSGCHRFRNVICDGNSAALPQKGKEFGLLMGGTYWYYVSVFSFNILDCAFAGF